MFYVHRATMPSVIREVAKFAHKKQETWKSSFISIMNVTSGNAKILVCQERDLQETRSFRE